ncbi:MAG: hypothetical protein ABIW33_07020 [Sphingomicrobium sp.]
MANTLDMDPEWGGIDLIEEVEGAFGIKVADKEAEGCWTVGDLYEVIRAHTPNWDEQDGPCASSAVFYRFRRALAPEDEREVSPRSALLDAGTSTRRLFDRLRRETRLRLPTEEATAIGLVGGWMCLLGFIGGLVALFTGAWALTGLGALVVVLGVLLLRVDPARLPIGVATVGDLVRRTVPLNAQDLAETGARPPDRWAILVALAAEHGSLPPDEIGPDTFLLRKGMELAAKRG